MSTVQPPELSVGERVKNFVTPYLAGIEADNLGEKTRELKIAGPIGFLLVNKPTVKETPVDKEIALSEYCGLDTTEWSIDFNTPLLHNRSFHGISVDSLLLEPTVVIHDEGAGLNYSPENESGIDEIYDPAEHISEIMDQLEALQAAACIEPIS